MSKCWMSKFWGGLLSSLFLKNAYLLSWSQGEFKSSTPSYFCWDTFSKFLPFINTHPEAFWHPKTNVRIDFGKFSSDQSTLIFISVLYIFYLMNSSPRDFLLCSPCIGQRKGEANPVRKCRKCKKYQVYCICQKEGPRTNRCYFWPKKGNFNPPWPI